MSQPVTPPATAGIEGCHRLLGRLFDLASTQGGRPTEEAERLRYLTIRKVTEAIESFRYNTAISALMEFISVVEKAPWREGVETLVDLISPFAPFAAEEIYRRRGGRESIHRRPWPAWDEALIRQSTVAVPVQIGGRVRGTVTIAADATQEEAEAAVAANPSLAAAAAGRAVRVYRPGRMISYP